jgi:hypothetical protein
MQLDSWIRYGETGKPQTLVIHLNADQLKTLDVDDVEIYFYSGHTGVNEKKYTASESI